MPKYIVEEISSFRIRYVIDTENAGYACDTVVCHEDDLTEFSQKHLGEMISSVREITDDEYLRLFDEDNDYLTSWTDEEKLSLVNKP